MTSGQGGSGQEPTGQPGRQGPDGGQGWGPPPQQQPPYPAAPPPQPPAYPAAPSAPPGYPPAPGYAPGPPAAWGGTPPKPVERPMTVRAGLGAFIASLVLGVIASALLFTDQSGALRAAIRASGTDVSEDVLRSALVVAATIGLVVVALEAMFIWFAWKGRNWARVVLWVLGGLGIVSGLSSLGGPSYGGFYTSLSVIQFLLVLGAVVLLALAPSNEWYRYQRWLRDTGQRR
jgi:hypothetical protein